MNSKQLVQLLSGIFLGLIVVFIVAGSIIYVRSTDKKNTPAPSSTPAKQTQNPTLSKADQLDSQGKYAESADTVKQYIDSNPSEDEKQKASLKLAAAYFNAKDYDKAIIWYEKIGQQSQEYKLASLHGLAYTYSAKGDNQKAIEYFHRAIDFVKTSNNQPDAELLISGDEQAIKLLQQKQ